MVSGWEALLTFSDLVICLFGGTLGCFGGYGSTAVHFARSFMWF
jgi:hypothetical protein